MNYSEYLMKGIVLFDSKKYDQSLKAFDKAISLNKNEEEAYFCKANC